MCRPVQSILLNIITGDNNDLNDYYSWFFNRRVNETVVEKRKTACNSRGDAPKARYRVEICKLNDRRRTTDTPRARFGRRKHTLHIRGESRTWSWSHRPNGFAAAPASCKSRTREVGLRVNKTARARSANEWRNPQNGFVYES